MLNRRGNTLILALVGAVIAAIVTIQLNQMFKTSFNSTRVITSTNDWESIGRNLTLGFETETNCTNAFTTSGVTSTFNTTVAVNSIASNPDTVSLNGTKMLAVGDAVGMYHVQSISLALLAPPAPYTYNSVARYRIPAMLKISATKDATATKMGKDTLTKSYLLSLVTEKTPASGANIVTCSSSGSGLQMQQVCSGIVGGVFDSTTQTCRIGVETRTSDPASPTNGQMWLRTDL